MVKTSYRVTFFQLGRRSKTLDPPVYGKIALPYSPYYGCNCQLECIDGHYLVGMDTDTCTVNKDDTMTWKNKTECRGINSNQFLGTIRSICLPIFYITTVNRGKPVIFSCLTKLQNFTYFTKKTASTVFSRTISKFYEQCVYRKPPENYFISL